MIPGPLIALVAFAYLGILFAVAYYGDKAASRGKSIIANAYVYSLSLAVYATAWTFYGSVGRASASGIGFLPVYLGPTVMATAWWLVLRKIIRIAKDNHITSLADFVSSRYGKSGLLAGLVTTIAVLGVTPYISLQLHQFQRTARVSGHTRGRAGGGSAGMARYRVLRRANTGGLHHRVRHPPYRCRRTP